MDSPAPDGITCARLKVGRQHTNDYELGAAREDTTLTMDDIAWLKLPFLI
jgi:hypothetical protein